MKVFKRRDRVSSPVVFCGSGNHVCDRQAVARAIRDQAKAAASAGHLAWR